MTQKEQQQTSKALWNIAKGPEFETQMSSWTCCETQGR